MSQESKHKGFRYNKGKLRFGLIPPEFLEALAEVYTKGAHKYSKYLLEDGTEVGGSNITLDEVVDRNLKMTYDGANNWRNGLGWMGAMESVDRHIIAWKKGEDIDQELQTQHLANAAWGLSALITFRKIYPQGDDRNKPYLNIPKIGLDIDEVLADWVHAWVKRWGMSVPSSWFFDRNIGDKFAEMKASGELDTFYMGLKPLLNPNDIPFEPHAYVTSRPVDQAITEKWLDLHGFPARPVHTIPLGTSKVEVIKSLGLDVFVDDRFDNFVELNNAGIHTYLYTAPHNLRYNVGSMRISSLNELLPR